MAPDSLRDTALIRGLTALIADLSDLIQKEVGLARAEITHKLTRGLQAGAWFLVAAVLGLATCLLGVEGIVFALASAGLALHWACFLVAALLAALAAIAVYYGRVLGAQDLMPTRTVRQFNETIRTAKEQIQ